jgi:hypothetical protein
MSSSIHTALHHRITLPSWLLAAMLAVVVAIGAVALAADSGSTSSGLSPASAASAPSIDQPTSCVDSTVVGHC